jgi:hypothetical protein
MKRLKNEKGIALVTALLLTMVIMAIILAVIYMVIQGTKVSGLQKHYQTARDAAYGGMDVTVKDILPRVIMGTTLSNALAGYADPNITWTAEDNACFSSKLSFTPDYWNCGSTANARSADVKTYPDFRFTLAGITGQANFVVYAKVVETITSLPVGLCTSQPCRAGNTSSAPVILEGEAVSASSTGINMPAHFPFLYRIDLQAERSTNPDERANLTGVYAY